MAYSINYLHCIVALQQSLRIALNYNYKYDIYILFQPLKGVFKGGEEGIHPPHVLYFFFEYNTLIYLKNVKYK
jgi:hypothetical protein